jgi:two-component system nitrogen regulation response regulator GlnG
VLLPTFLPELRRETPAAAAGALNAQPNLAQPDLEQFIRARLGSKTEDLYDVTHREVDRLLLPLALNATNGNQHQAARLLGIARQTLRLKLRELGLHITQSVEAEEGQA